MPFFMTRDILGLGLEVDFRYLDKNELFSDEISPSTDFGFLRCYSDELLHLPLSQRTPMNIISPI